MKDPHRRTAAVVFVMLTLGALLSCQHRDRPSPVPEVQRADRAAPVNADPAARPSYVSGLLGSAHDFSRGDAHPRDLCLPCHAAHLPDRGPAWNAYTADGMELDRGSLLCMSCHDGVVASDVFTSSHATRLASQVGASQLGFGGLQGHPVGIDFPTGRATYHPPAAVRQQGVPLPDGRVQCSSCHDPHNVQRLPGMLVTSNERSRLCLSCHRL